MVFMKELLCAFWLLPYSMKMLAAAALTACLLLKPKSLHYNVKRVLTTFCQVVNQVLEIYATEDATEDIIAKTDREIARLVDLSNMSTLELANEL